MLNRNNKNSGGRILFNSKFLALLGMAVIILISIPLAKNISRRYKIDREIKDMEQEISELESRSSGLSDLISYLESSQFVEEQARLKLGFKKQGEEAVVIKENERAGEFLINKEGGSDGSINFSGPVSNPEKWWGYFFD